MIGVEITSINNPKVKLWQKLKIKKYRDSEKLFLVEGDHLVENAINDGIVKEIITTDKDKIFKEDVYYVNDKIMKGLSSQVTSTNLIAVCHIRKEKDISGNIIILDRLQDPGNLGTIIRSAVAFNFTDIILSDDSVDLYNDKVIRASEGMFFNINIIRTNIVNFIKNLSNDYTLITTDVKGGDNIKNIKGKKIAIVIGNEGSGVKDEIADLCKVKVHIPMNKNCESLNAAISASILMYEVNNG